MCISDKNVTYKGNLLQSYYKHIRSEMRATVFAFATVSVPITSKAHYYTPETPPPLNIISNIRTEECSDADCTVAASAPTKRVLITLPPAMLT